MDFGLRLVETLEKAGFSQGENGDWHREDGTTLNVSLLLSGRARAHEILDLAVLRLVAEGSGRCRIRLTPQTEEGGAVVKITR